MNKCSLRDYEEDVYRCIRCGFCRAVCPVLQEEDMNETVGPRSFVLTARGLITNELRPSGKMGELIYECVECGACNVKCPPGVKIEEIIGAVRDTLVRSHSKPPRNIKSLIDSVQERRRLYDGQPDDETTHGLLDKPAKEKADVLYYVGCAASQLERDQARSMIRILEKAGTDFTILRNEECCGLPLSTLGFRELFVERAEKNAQMFEQVEASTVVTTCPGCYKTFSRLYPQRAKPHRILHSSQFIKDLIEQKKIVPMEPVRKRLTYHDPCDLGRHMGVFDPPRDVIKSIPDVEFVEAKRNRMEAQCCGAGAGFTLAYPELAKSINATRLRKDIQNIGAEMLVTSCPNCAHLFREVVRSIENTDLKSIDVVDLTELVARSIKGEHARPD